MKQAYQCEICKTTYGTPELAIECESQLKIANGTEIAWDKIDPKMGHQILIGTLTDVVLDKHNLAKAKVLFEDGTEMSNPNLRFVPTYVELAKMMRFIGLDCIPNTNTPELKR